MAGVKTIGMAGKKKPPRSRGMAREAAAAKKAAAKKKKAGVGVSAVKAGRAMQRQRKRLY